MTRLRLLLAALAFAAALGSDAALAQEGGEIRWGWGDTIVPVCALPPDVHVRFNEETNQRAAVGYCFGRWFVFAEGFNLWTWNGRYVLFQGSRYAEMTDDDFVRLLGREKFESLGKPITYRIPLGLVAIAALVGGIIVVARFAKPARAQRLLQDERQQQALEVYCKFLESLEEPTLQDRQQALATAVEFLVTQHGLPADKSDANLRLAVSEMDRGQSYELRQEAVEYEQSGNWQEAVQLYEQAAELQRPWDLKDHAFLLKCVARVRSKQVREDPRLLIDLPDQSNHSSSGSNLG